MSAQKLHRLHAHIQHDPSGDGVDRRGFLECMAWAGTGLLWTVSAGVLSSSRLALAGEAPPPGTFHFAQISDSHIGFAAGANRDVTATLQLALAKVKTLQPTPAFVLHTGDLTHGQKAAEFDTLEGTLQGAGIGQVFYVPGEHDVFADAGKEYLARHGKGTLGDGWQSFDYQGVHFIGLVNVLNLKPGGLGASGRSSWHGWRRTWQGSPAARRSWSSPTSHSGRSTPRGAGGQTMGSGPSAFCGGSAR